jgi:DNA-3-methyladenine glycosylase
MYHCLKIVSGIELMRRRRKTAKIEDLCNGPGKLTRAFGITGKHNNLSLFEGKIEIHNSREKPEIVTAGRVGLSAGKDLLLRFYIRGNRFVSVFEREG